MNKLPVEIIQTSTNFDEIITDECNKYVARMGYDIIFNKYEFAEMLKLYINKPYEFEDLKPDMWVYDLKAKRYLLVTDTTFQIMDLVGFIYTNYSGYQSKIEFEPNRFYPREVK